MTKTCPRCQQPFSCRPEAMPHCGCAAVPLTDEDLRYIRTHVAQQFGGYVCLCVNCLRELAAARAETASAESSTEQ